MSHSCAGHDGWRSFFRHLRGPNLRTRRRGFRTPHASSCEALERRALLTAYVVDSNGDDPSGDGTVADGRLTLREAITAANTNAAFGDAEAGTDLGPDTIHFAPSLDGQTIVLGGEQLAITGLLTITGRGPKQLTISGNHLSRVFSIDSGIGVSISGLTVAHGSATSGGGIFNAGSLSLVNSLVSTNVASLGGQGGGVYNQGTLSITASRFSTNAAAGIGFGGGLYNAGMAGVYDSDFIDNTAGTGEGGGINNAGTATLSLIRSRISGSSADFGGGILNAGSLSVENSALSGNVASGSGGAVSNRGFMSINSSQLTGNTAGQGGAIANGIQAGATVTFSTISGNSAAATRVVPFGIGGGLFNSGGALAVENSTVAGNTANFGGGIALGFPTETVPEGLASFDSQDAGVQAILPQLNLSNVTVSGNTASDSGGGIFLDGETHAVLRNVTVVRNRAAIESAGSGGGIFVDVGDAPTLYNTIVAGNELFIGMPGTPNDVAGTLDPVSSHNLVGDTAFSGGLTNGMNGNIVGVDWTTVIDPVLSDNGGPTLTHALLPDGLARDNGDDAQSVDTLDNPLTTDQRGTGFLRIRGFAVDIGAFEAALVRAVQGDFNGDRLADVVEMKTNGEWWVGLSDGIRSLTKELWTTWASSSTWAHVDFGDFNGDGLTDIVGVTKWGGVWVALSNGTDGFHTATRWIDPNGVVASWIHIGVGDFDGNGFADIAGFAADGSWSVTLSDGAASFVASAGAWDIWVSAYTWVDLEFGDFNGDGFSDIAGFTRGGGWWVGLNNALGESGSPDAGRFTHSHWAAWASATEWADFEVGDFDGDGSDDIAGFDINGDWHIGVSNGAGFDTGATSAYWATLSTWVKIGLGDFNADGFADLVGVTTWGGWWVGLNSTAGGCDTSFWAKWGHSSYWSQFDLSDIDGNGATDAVGLYTYNRADWQVGLSNRSDALVGQLLWGDWDLADSWATLNDALTVRRQLDRLALV